MRSISDGFYLLVVGCSFFLVTTLSLTGTVVASELSTIDERFKKATVKEKYEIINNVLASEAVDTSFLSSVLNTDKFLSSFPSVDVYRALKSRTAIKLGEIGAPEMIKLLYVYYYGNARNRFLKRPDSYEFKYDWQTIVAQTEDSKGTQWALTKIWWFRCRNDLWLVKKDQGNTHWSGPWFTGISSRELSAMWLEDNYIHIINSESGQESVISLEMLIEDSDGDGLYNVEERRFETDHLASDSDGDGIIDGEDMNPLSAGAEDLHPWDYVRIAVLRHEALGDYPYTLYLIAADDDDRLEYFSPSSNAIILSMTPDQMERFQLQCVGHARRDVITRKSMRDIGTVESIRFSLVEKLEDEFYIDVKRTDMVNRYRVEKKDGVWVVTDEQRSQVY
jgi:hypothetical protein